MRDRDVVTLAAFTLNLVVMALAAVTAERCGSGLDRSGCDHFALSMAGARLLLVSFLLYACAFNPGARAAEATRLAGHALVVALWLANTAVPDGSDCPAVEFSACWLPYIATWDGAIAVDFLSACGPVLLPALGLGR